jgi:hypothetical protein
MAVHKLKSWPEFFEPLASGAKPFELRKNDRDYQLGDHLLLQEWEPRTQTYSGREVLRRISYVMRGVGHVGAIEPFKGLSSGYVILGLDNTQEIP